MTFAAPYRLFFLVFVFALFVAYVILQRRKRVYALRFSSVELFDSAVTRSPMWRKHIPAGLFLCALAATSISFAQPLRSFEAPKEQTTIILALDVSLSMEAQDVEPTRIEAAQQAAQRFIDDMPDTIDVGLVTFSGQASVVVSPTKDRATLAAALTHVQLDQATAIGDAIGISLRSIEGFHSLNAAEPFDPQSAKIVLLSDGETTAGRSEQDAIADAKQAGIEISTISFGTPSGYILYDDPATASIERLRYNVPVAEQNLQEIATATNGISFQASSLEELDNVYDNISSTLAYETKTQQIAHWFNAIALVLLVAVATMSLFWFQRLP